jgi:hypothetical protein
MQKGATFSERGTFSNFMQRMESFIMLPGFILEIPKAVSQPNQQQV